MSEILTEKESIIDLGSENSSENILFQITNIIEQNNFQDKKVKINFGELSIDTNQLSNILSVLKGFQIEPEIVYSSSTETKIAAVEAGLTVSGNSFELPQKPESNDSNEESYVEKIFDPVSGSENKETLYVKQTLRSGQKVDFDGNVVLIGDCNAGSEISATGDITIWGILSGIAHAGIKGDRKSCIRAFRINAIQIRIADLLARKPDSLDLEKSERSNLFTPEEAKVSEDEIIIYSLHS